MKKNKIALVSAFAAIFITACSFDLTSGYSASPRKNFEAFWNLFNEEYAAFGDKGIDWTAVRDQYAPGIREDMDEKDLFDVFTAMIYLLNDCHIHLKSPHYYANGGKENEKRTYFSANVVKNYVTDAQDSPDGHFTWGRLASRSATGYLRIANFVPPQSAGSMAKSHSDWAERIDAILDTMRNADSLIFDLRDNTGGLMQDVAYIAGRFYDATIDYAVIQDKVGPGANDFSSPYPIRIVPTGGTKAPKVPIVVLTNELTTSAGEFMTLAMLKVPGAIQAGNRTAGAFSFRTLHELPNGWTVTVSMQRVRTPEGISFEGRGISPDASRTILNTEPSIAAGKDIQLELAISLL